MGDGQGRIDFPIETERLLLRPFVLEDTPEIDPIYRETWPHWPGPLSQSLSDTRAHVERRMAIQRRRGFSFWLAREARSGVAIGHCGLQPLEGIGPEVEVGYALGRSHWGRGFATEGAAACVRVGFEQLGLRRLVAVTMPENAGSRQVMEKLGMRYERTGTFHGAVQVLYALSSSDARSPSKPG